MRTMCITAGLAAGLALFAATGASAAPQGSTPDAKPEAASAPISDSELADMSGGTETVPTAIIGVLTSQTFTATNTGNIVSAGNNVSSGDVNIGNDAFQGFSGIGNFVINTGHNNNLLGNLSVSINMAPGGTP